MRGVGRCRAAKRIRPIKLAEGAFKLLLRISRTVKGISEVAMIAALVTKKASQPVRLLSAHNIALTGIARSRSFASYERWYVTSMDSGTMNASGIQALACEDLDL